MSVYVALLANKRFVIKRVKWIFIVESDADWNRKHNLYNRHNHQFTLKSQSFCTCEKNCSVILFFYASHCVSVSWSKCHSCGGLHETPFNLFIHFKFIQKHTVNVTHSLRLHLGFKRYVLFISKNHLTAAFRWFLYCIVTAIPRGIWLIAKPYSENPPQPQDLNGCLTFFSKFQIFEEESLFLIPQTIWGH